MEKTVWQYRAYFRCRLPKMAKKLLILIISIFLCNLAYSELILPTNYEVSVQTHEESNQNFLIRNTFDLKLYDVQFGGLPGFDFPYFDLDKGEERIVNYTILRNDTGEFNYNAEVSYKYEVNLPIEQDTHYISITHEGFIPNFITIRKGDGVIWTNNDSIIRTVTSSSFDRSLDPNETYEREFNNVGTITYQDLTLFQGGTISVVNETQGQLVQNPDLNVNWQVKLMLYLENTSLEITNTVNNYTVDVNDTAEGLMEIRNIGNYTAESINLKATPAWLNFEDSNFDLESDKNYYLIYQINPLLFETSETNRTHNITIEISSKNTETYQIELSVYVPYSEVLDDLGSQEGFLSFYMKYCQANPNTLICNNTLGQSEEPKIIYRDPEIPINLTQKEAYAMLRRQGEIFSSVEVMNNEIKKVLNTISNDLPEIKKELGEIKIRQMEIEEERDSSNLAFWLILLFAILVSVTLVIGYSITKLREVKMRSH